MLPPSSSAQSSVITDSRRHRRQRGSVFCIDVRCCRLVPCGVYQASPGQWEVFEPPLMDVQDHQTDARPQKAAVKMPCQSHSCHQGGAVRHSNLVFTAKLVERARVGSHSIAASARCIGVGWATYQITGGNSLRQSGNKSLAILAFQGRFPVRPVEAQPGSFNEMAATCRPKVDHTDKWFPQVGLKQDQAFVFA